MPDRKRTGHGLECCIESDRTGFCPANCPYGEADGDCEMQLKEDALALIKAQQRMIQRLRNQRDHGCPLKHGKKNT